MLFELVSTEMLWYYCSLLLYYIVLNKPVSKPLWVAHVVFQTLPSPTPAPAHSSENYTAPPPPPAPAPAHSSENYTAPPPPLLKTNIAFFVTFVERNTIEVLYDIDRTHNLPTRLDDYYIFHNTRTTQLVLFATKNYEGSQHALFNQANKIDLNERACVTLHI